MTTGRLVGGSNGDKKMRKPLAIGVVLSALLVMNLGISCTKEKTITSTEYVHEIKYVESPADTVFVLDTVYSLDSVQVPILDTVVLMDTIIVHTTVHDTVISNHYDTVVIVDTIVQPQFAPSAVMAIMAMEIQTDPLVLEFVQQELGQSDGWIFYLTPQQMYLKQISAKVYDIGAYVDYYAADFSGHFPLEVGWRMTYISGDPAIASNWQMSEPPTGATSYSPGINLSAKATQGRLIEMSGRK
jgi:hypothetical protein